MDTVPSDIPYLSTREAVARLGRGGQGPTRPPRFPDNHVMLERGMVIYDALYAWVGNARGEAHNAELFKK